MEILYIVIALSIIAAVVFFVRRWKNKKVASARAHRARNNLGIKVPAALPHIYDEPDQPFFSSVVSIPDVARRMVAEGIKIVIEATRIKFPHWQQFRSLADFNVMFVEPDAISRVDVPGAPALMVWGIQSAGTVIGIPGDSVNKTTIVLPHQAATDWRFLNYLKNSARHEAEHVAELNDMSVFNSYIGEERDVHPRHFLPEEQQIRGFAAGRARGGHCGLSSIK